MDVHFAVALSQQREVDLPPEPSKGLIKRFVKWAKSVSDDDVCPDLPVQNAVPLIKEGVSEIERTGAPISLQQFNLWGHHYMHMEKVLDWKDLPEVEFGAALQKKYLRSRIAWPIVWTSSLGSGWSTLEDGPLSTQIVKQRKATNVSIFGTGEWPEADVVTMRSQETYVEKIPRLLAIQSFEAKTRAGHALTGTVLHMLVATEIGLYFCALGASQQGAPLVGGFINNRVALHPWYGSWPTLVGNMRQNLRSVPFWRSLTECVTRGTYSQEDLRRNTALLYKEMPFHEWLRQSGTQRLVMFGWPLRYLSWSYYWFAALFGLTWPKDKEKD